MPRRAGLVLVGLVLATVLTGCSPAPVDQVAIRRINGEVGLVFAPCPGKRIHDLVFNEENIPDWRGWSISGGPEAVVMSVTLFETPVGWSLGNHTLTELEPGVSYYTKVYSSDGTDSDLRFITLEAIEELGDGQVLGPGETASRATPMSMGDFTKRAASSCD